MLNIRSAQNIFEQALPGDTVFVNSDPPFSYLNLIFPPPTGYF